jgi:hypothetical protein
MHFDEDVLRAVAKDLRENPALFGMEKPLQIHGYGSHNGRDAILLSRPLFAQAEQDAVTAAFRKHTGKDTLTWEQVQDNLRIASQPKEAPPPKPKGRSLGG